MLFLTVFTSACIHEGNEVQENSEPTQETTPQTHSVSITSTGFEPQTITIKAGDNVVWTNNGDSQHWPASAVHPTHKTYPGSDIQKCQTAEEQNIFDACKGFGPEETYTFTFNEKGKWNYHDHLVPGRFGTINVQ